MELAVQRPTGNEGNGRGNASGELSAVVFDIQKFAIHDGPGIRTLVFFKGCPMRCEWCSNPESQLRQPQLVVFSGRCIGCTRCVEACPQEAVNVDDQGHMQFDRTRCADCGACTESCFANARVLLGREMTVAEVLTEVRKDAVFYSASGGGVTLGGGEVTVWPEFAEELLLALRGEKIDAAIETCGQCAWESLERLLPHVDLVYYDVKHMDPDAHRRLTGVDNERVLENARLLGRQEVPAIVRIPIVPGRNDDVENIRATAAFVRRYGVAEKIELLPYHRFAEDKYQRLGRHYGLAGLEPPNDERMSELADVVRREALACQVGG